MDCPFSIPGKVWKRARGHPWKLGRFRSVAPCAACGGRRSLTGKAGALAPYPPSLPRHGPGQDKRISGKEGFAACGGKRGSRPRPLRWAASLPPLAACGPLSLPTLGGGVAPPAPPAVAVGVMWRPRPRLRRVPVKLAASRSAGHPWPPQGQAPSGPLRGPCPGHSPRSGAALVLQRGPAPTMWGLWGRPRLRPGRRRSGPRPGFGPACGAASLWAACLRTRRPA